MDLRGLKFKNCTGCVQMIICCDNSTVCTFAQFAQDIHLCAKYSAVCAKYTELSFMYTLLGKREKGSVIS